MEVFEEVGTKIVVKEMPSMNVMCSANLFCIPHDAVSLTDGAESWVSLRGGKKDGISQLCGRREMKSNASSQISFLNIKAIKLSPCKAVFDPSI